MSLPILTKVVVFLGTILLLAQFLGKYVIAADCGRNTVTDSLVAVGPRIHVPPETGGGLVTERGLWPWLASLGRFHQGKWKHFCGGTLVTRKHVLTAAHCLVKEVTAVRLGDGNLSDNLGVQRRLIINYKTHPKYELGLPYFDVAVLTINPPADITGKYVRPICLPDQQSDAIDEFDGQQLDVAGWGLAVINGFANDVEELRQAQQKVFRNSFCNESHATNKSLLVNQKLKHYLPSLFTPDLMCAGYEFGGSGSCKGDSGGPLMRYAYGNGPSSARFVQQGIIQGGVGICGSKDFPSIYVRIKNPEVFAFIKDSITSVESRLSNELATKLYNATIANDILAVQSLLDDNGQNLDFVNNRILDRNGVLRTSLDIASAHGYIEIVKLLIQDAKADPNIKDGNGYSATYKSAQNGHLEVLKILVEEGGANVDAANGPDGNTALMTAVDKSGDLGTVSYLIQRVDSVDTTNFKGYTALFIAIKSGNFDIIRALLKEGSADLDKKNGNSGWTASMRAAALGNLRILKLLAEEGNADPQIKSNRLGKSALHIASYNGHTTVVRYLITHANLNATLKDSDGFTPLYLAAQTDSIGVVRFLVEKANVDINSKNGNDLNSIPLAIASQNGHTTTVRYLLNHGAKTHVDYLDSKNISSLYYATQQGNIEVIKILIDQGGANVNLMNTDKLWTALHVAAYEGHAEIVNYFVQILKVNPFQMTGDGKDTPLSLAEKNGQEGAAANLRLMYNWLLKLSGEEGDEVTTQLMRKVLSTPPYSIEQFFPWVNASAVFLAKG